MPARLLCFRYLSSLSSGKFLHDNGNFFFQANAHNLTGNSINYETLFAVIMACVLSLVSHPGSAQTDVEKKLKELGIELIPPTKPVANYVKSVRTGNLVFLAGHGPAKADGTVITGKVGRELTLESGAEAARITAISLLSTLKAEIGDLNKVVRIVKVTGWVNCHADFTDQPKVMNGCSDLLVSVFGERGKHARSSLGANTLPFNYSVEIEMVVEVAP
jgi:enamine deaminase RidA (YjgF/YER057c/UK114 family)